MQVTLKQLQNIKDKIINAMMNHPWEWMPYPQIFMEALTSANHGEFQLALGDLQAEGRIERYWPEGQYHPEYKINQ